MPVDPLSRFRGRIFDLPDTDDRVAGLSEVIEQETAWRQPLPDFVLDLSGGRIPDWIAPSGKLHGSYLCRHRAALVFAQNSTLDVGGTWGCETQRFRTQFMAAFARAGYAAMYPGAKPDIRQVDGAWRLSVDNLKPDDVERIDEPVFLATPLEPDNWGRWVATVMPKAMSFLRLADGSRFFCRIARPWQKTVLNDLGITDDRILGHDPGRTYLCRDIATIRYSATSMTVSAEERLIYAGLAERWRPAMALPAGEKLFVSRLSRSLRRPNYRALQNEAALIAALEARGLASSSRKRCPSRSRSRRSRVQKSWSGWAGRPCSTSCSASPAPESSP
jgi:hypothetical protein